MTWRDLNLLAGALVRRIRARVIDASASGCLVESAAALEEGTIGLLDFDGDDAPPTEAVRICRSVPVHGGTMPFRTALEFLSLSAPAPGSMRHELADCREERGAAGHGRRIACAGDGQRPARPDADQKRSEELEERGSDRRARTDSPQEPCSGERQHDC